MIKQGKHILVAPQTLFVEYENIIEATKLLRDGSLADGILYMRKHIGTKKMLCNVNDD